MSAQHPTERWRLAIVGAVAGVLAGLLGIGGGIVLVPGLAWATGIDRHTATGTSLLAIVPIAVVGSTTYALAPGGKFDAPAAALLVAGSLAGALIGAWLSAKFTDRGLRLTFAVVSGLLGARLIVPFGLGAGSKALPLTLGAVITLVLLGFFGGVLSGLLGIGGSGVLVAVMVITLGADQALAQGIALTSIIPTALVGAAAYGRRGQVAVRPGIAAGLVGAVVAVPASAVALALPSTALRAAFGAFLLLMAARTLVRQRRTRRAVVPA
jgi:uncharacterized membrane protein YfcA